jgi:hypothetical protein
MTKSPSRIFNRSPSGSTGSSGSTGDGSGPSGFTSIEVDLSFTVIVQQAEESPTFDVTIISPVP